MSGNDAIEGIAMCARQASRTKSESCVDRQQRVSGLVDLIEKDCLKGFRLWQFSTTNFCPDLPRRSGRSIDCDRLIGNDQ